MSLYEFTSNLKASFSKGVREAIRQVHRPSPNSHQSENWSEAGLATLPGTARSDLQLSNSTEGPRLHWAPTRVEVCRILSVAKDLHNQRVNRGEIPKNSPITIAEVGAGSGHFMGLVIEEARKQNLKIRVAIIDPCNDRQSHKADVKEIQTYSEMRFFRETSAEFLQKLYAKNPEVKELIKKRETIKHLALIAQGLEYPFDDCTPREAKQFLKNLQMVNAVFGTSFSTSDFSDLGAYESNTKPALVAAIRQKFEAISNQIEVKLSTRPAGIDLVVNAWMPSDLDFSCDIRALNGAGIVYVLKRFGCTGFQPESLEGAPLPWAWWMGTSYDNHGQYANKVSWRGAGPAGVLVQCRSGYSIDVQQLNNAAPEEDYSWIERRAPVRPVHELAPTEHYLQALWDEFRIRRSSTLS